jgi:amino acid efflux transporter
MPITTARGVALYVGALLGPGLLVLPGLAAALAGPASILAWAGLLVLSGLVAVVFARLGAAHPSAGGVAEYARLGLGAWAGRAVAWCFLAGIVTGAPVVCLMGAGYLAELFGAGTLTTTLAAGALVIVVLTVSLRGVRTSTTVQLGLVAVLVVMILAAVAVAVPAADAGNWVPFAPHGWPAIGSAATVLMLSFVGWEAIAPLTDRFADPARQLPRVIGTAFALTAVIYLGLAAATVAALGGQAGTDVPLAALLSLGLGTAGPVVAAAGAVVLTLGTANAYLTGGAALAGSLSPAGRRMFPAAILAASAVILVLIGAGLLSLETAVTVPAMFFVVVYLFCMVGAVRTVTGVTRAAATVAAAAITVVLAYAGTAVLPAAVVAAVAATHRPRRRVTRPPGPDAPEGCADPVSADPRAS